MPAGRAFALRVLLVVMAGAIFLGTGETALRIIYRDDGKRTLGGPGGRRVRYLLREDESARPSRSRREESGHAAHHDRGRLDHLRAGRPRLAGRVAGAARASRSNTPAHRTRWRCWRCLAATFPRMSSEIEAWAKDDQARRLHLSVVRQRHRSRQHRPPARAGGSAGRGHDACAAALVIPSTSSRQPARVPAAAAGSVVRAVHPRRLRSGEPGVGGVRALLPHGSPRAHRRWRPRASSSSIRRCRIAACRHSSRSPLACARCAARTPSRFRRPRGFDRPDSWSIGRTRAGNRR